MNIKQFIRKHGWQMECNSKPGRVMCVDVGFIDDEGREDETQMDINAYDEQELSRLFADFCKENKFPTNTVTSVVIVQIADSMEELLYGQVPDEILKCVALHLWEYMQLEKLINCRGSIW